MEIVLHMMLQAGLPGFFHLPRPDTVPSTARASLQRIFTPLHLICVPSFSMTLGSVEHFLPDQERPGATRGMLTMVDAPMTARTLAATPP